ncbi:MAG TPA: sulfite exporter TauE/SafE family protein, partial [bacterium]|nr:sulfite exporter TauE/SafE family protein [bacterium]
MIAALISAIWLGILTSISPCPLATNIAAVSYISKNLSDKKSV